MGIITRIGGAPGARRLVRRAPRPGEVRENGDDDENEPMWCSGCRREVMFELTTCPECGGVPMTVLELSRHDGDLPAAGAASPTAWRSTPLLGKPLRGDPSPGAGVDE
jgi:hypothetical protein